MVLSSTKKIQKVAFWLLIFFCFFIQIIPVIRSGLTYSYGIGFWGANGHDAVWHLSLINHISNPLKIDMPIYSGEVLKNYHPLFDILIAFLSKITYINSSLWLFQIFPVVTTVFFIYLSYKIGKKITGTSLGGLILVTLNSLNNSLGWIVTLLRQHNFAGESLFWAMQSPSNQLNPPYMLSILLLLALIYLLSLPKPSKIAIILILSFLPIIKVYSALPAFIIFFFYVLKHRRYLSTLIISVLLSGLLFLHYNSTSASLLKFEPFWFVNSMVESKDRLFLPRFAGIRYALESTARIGPRLVAYYLVFTAIFIVGNFAWRLLAFREILKNKVYLLIIFLCTLIPLLFIQRGTSWNTIQFIYYALFLANIPLTLYLTKHRIQALIIFVLTLLPLISSLPNYLGALPPTAISPGEVSALNFLKQQPQGNVLTYPYNQYLRYSLTQKPLPLFAYETTSYVAAYSRHTTFLEDQMNLENSGYDWSTRRQASLDFFAQKNEFIDRGFLVNNQIDYIYLPKSPDTSSLVFSPQMYLEPIFDNPEVSIYRVKR